MCCKAVTTTCCFPPGSFPRRPRIPTDPPRHATAAECFDERELGRIEELFHGLIRSRMREGNLPVPNPLPSIFTLTPGDDPAWFPIAGMCGGFAYRLVTRGHELQLIAESWSRVADGSGMRHVITPTQVVLDAEGFV